MGLSARAAWMECVSLLDRMAPYGGVATILWHTRSLSPERLWNETYIRLISELERRGAWFGAAEAVTSWYRARRQLQLGRPSFTADEARLSIQGANANPGFILRVHQPVPGQAARSYDAPWDGRPDAVIPFAQEKIPE